MKEIEIYNTDKVILVDNQNQIHLGVFKSEIDAAKAYNRKAEELFGEYANLNEV